MSTDTNHPTPLPTDKNLRFNIPLLLAVILAATTLSLLLTILLKLVTQNTIPTESITVAMITVTTSTAFFIIAHMQRVPDSASA